MRATNFELLKSELGWSVEEEFDVGAAPFELFNQGELGAESEEAFDEGTTS